MHSLIINMKHFSVELVRLHLIERAILSEPTDGNSRLLLLFVSFVNHVDLNVSIPWSCNDGNGLGPVVIHSSLPCVYLRLFVVVIIRELETSVLIRSIVNFPDFLRTGAAESCDTEEHGHDKNENQKHKDNDDDSAHLVTCFFCFTYRLKELCARCGLFVCFLLSVDFLRLLVVTTSISDRAKLVNAELGPVTPCSMESNERSIWTEANCLVFHF